jgi:hypothetical protein
MKNKPSVSDAVIGIGVVICVCGILIVLAPAIAVEWYIQRRAMEK